MATFVKIDAAATPASVQSTLIFISPAEGVAQGNTSTQESCWDRNGRVDEIEVNNKNQIIWESYLLCCSSGSFLPIGASETEKGIGPPGMGSPIGKRRVMMEMEGSSSNGSLFIIIIGIIIWFFIFYLGRRHYITFKRCRNPKRIYVLLHLLLSESIRKTFLISVCWLYSNLLNIKYL